MFTDRRLELTCERREPSSLSRTRRQLKGGQNHHANLAITSGVVDDLHLHLALITDSVGNMPVRSFERFFVHDLQTCVQRLH